jgi:hypothetical protein
LVYHDRSLQLSRPELAALQAVDRGVTQLRMPLRVQARLLERGLIGRPGARFIATDAGVRLLRPRRTNNWM